MSQYKTLRMWSGLLIILGVFSLVSAVIGVIGWAIAVDGFWETLGVLLIGAPVALLLATWPIALGQALRAIADIGDAVVVGDGAPL
jgi:Zn-dependent membrane protease YugP